MCSRVCIPPCVFKSSMSYMSEQKSSKEIDNDVELQKDQQSDFLSYQVCVRARVCVHSPWK